MPSLYGVDFCLLNSLDKLIHSLNVPINLVSQIKSTQLRRMLRRPMRRCSSKWNVASTVLTQLSLFTNPTLMAFVQPNIPMSSQNVGFSSAKNRVLSGAYTYTYDDGAVLHCFIASQREMAVLWVSKLRNAWTYWLTIWHTWLRWWHDLVSQIS